jgi:uncharacterized membrane protein YdjX (TVP38/TMEM64 family)
MWQLSSVFVFTRLTVPSMLRQGFAVFGDILTWFQQQNNWGGWAIFLAMYTVNVALLLPGIILILGAGFVFG